MVYTSIALSEAVAIRKQYWICLEVKVNSLSSTRMKTQESMYRKISGLVFFRTISGTFSGSCACTGFRRLMEYSLTSAYQVTSLMKRKEDFLRASMLRWI